MKRILHVFGKLDRGGAETMIMNLYRKIDRNNLQFDFVVHTEEVGDYESEILKYGGAIYRVPSYRGNNHFQYVQAWKQLLDEHPEFEIVHGHVRSTAAIYLYMAKHRGKITISHSHSTTSGNGFSAQIKNILQLPIRYIADYMVAPSEAAAIWLFGKNVVNKSNFFVLKNSIDAKLYTYNESTRLRIREQLNIENKFVIGHVGRFHQLKNHEFLIDIFYEILKKNKDSVLMLIGDGELYSIIKNKVSLLGIKDQVLFLGKKENVYDYYQAMDMFVFPSYYEGLGLVVIEAQAAGLKSIVSSRIPKEAYLSELVVPLSLDLSVESWSEAILNNKDYLRLNTFKNIEEQDYDIDSNVDFIQTFYLKLSMDSNNN